MRDELMPTTHHPHKPISVLIVSPNLFSAGMEKQLVMLLHRVNHQAFHIELAIFRDHDCPLRHQIPGHIKIIDLQKKSRMDIAFIFRLYKLIRSGSWDVIDSRISGVNEYLLAICGLLKKSNLIVEIRSTRSVLRPYYLMMGLLFRIFKLPWTTICNNKKAADELSSYLPAQSPIHFIPNGVDVGQYAADHPQFARDPFKIGFLGRIIPAKNLKRLLRAFAEIQRHRSSSKLVQLWIGGRPDNVRHFRHLQSCVEHYGLSSSVVWLGDIEHVQDFFKQIDLFVLPSIYEGTPNALLEAMASQRVCLVSRGANTDHFIQQDYVFETNDVHDLASKLNRLIELSPDERKTIGLQNQQVIRARYQAEKMTSDYEALWRQVAAGANGSQ